MKISIIGTGYVGLVSAACFADSGHSVLSLDKDKSKIKLLSSGKTSIFEPGLKTLLKKNIKDGRLSFTTSFSRACNADLLILCIDTPSKKSGDPDLKNLNIALRQISKVLRKDLFLIIKSTVPIGTNEYIDDFFKKNSKFKVEIISNPEFLKEGSAVQDFVFPSRIIVGCNSEASKKIMKKLYAPLKLAQKKIIFMSANSAELTKYASNSFLATKISFINKISQLADLTNANIHDIKLGLGSDPRIGEEFLNAGLGYGGSCFPKDIKALISLEKKSNLPFSIFSVVEKINNQQYEIFYNKILRAFENSNLKNKSFFIWGLSFKPNTDDIRDSISIRLIKKLSPQVKHIYVYDPQAMPSASKSLSDIKNITFSDNSYHNIEKSHALVLCTEWNEFKNPVFKKLKNLKDKKIFDGRNFLEKSEVIDHGIEYIGLGIN